MRRKLTITGDLVAKADRFHAASSRGVNVFCRFLRDQPHAPARMPATKRVRSNAMLPLAVDSR